MKLKTVLSNLILGFVLCSNQTSISFNSIPQKNVDDVICEAYLGDGVTDTLFDQLSSNIDSETYVDDTYASYYFNNLRENFGNNVFGSCGYVSIGMLLSFYDSYWDDSFISNTYDINSTFTATKQPSADFYLVPSYAESPGIQFESSNLFGDTNISIDDYLDIANQNKNTYFQFKLFDVSKEYFGRVKLDSAGGSLGLDSQDIYDLLDYYIHNHKGFSKDEVKVNLYTASNTAAMKTSITNNIKNGTPVILVVKQPNTSKAHSVIAYDYNASNGEIYVHTGWKDEASGVSLTHVSLSDLGYTEIVSKISLDVNSSKNLGEKYFAQSGEGIDSSTFIFPREVELVSGNYADMNPTFSWKTLYSEKWERDKNPYINFSILNSSRISIFKVTGIRGTSYTLNTAQWERVRFDVSGKKYYVLVTLDSDSYPYWDDYWCRDEFTKPDTYQNTPYIAPDEYGFGDSYPTAETTKNNYKSHTIRGFTFETRRYRVGYIHNEDIVMSPIRQGINEAFIEYRFKKALTRIDVDLSHWREQSNELLSSSNGTAAIQQYIDNEWVPVLDLLSSDTNLPRNRNDKSTYKIEFSRPAYRIRFYSHYNGTSSENNNRGRICIGNMAFYQSTYNLPLSGSELDYNPDSWNKTEVPQVSWPRYIYQYTNCYSYAVNAQINPTTHILEPMQPGQASGKSLSDEDLPNINKVLTAIKSDASILGFELDDIDADTPCPEGTYKVAFVLDNQYSPGDQFKYDYHWYRQNSDGTWSHKPGTTPVRNTDYSNQIIMDPRRCDRNAGQGINYNLFFGFYTMRPLNIMY